MKPPEPIGEDAWWTPEYYRTNEFSKHVKGTRPYSSYEGHVFGIGVI
jgi:hypothetical protein